MTVNESLEIDNPLSKIISSVDANVVGFGYLTDEERKEWFHDANNLLEDEHILDGFDHHEMLSNDATLITPQDNYMLNYTPVFDPMNDPNSIPYVFPNDNDLLVSNSLLTPPRSNEGFQFDQNLYSPKYTNYPNAINTPLTDYASSPERSSPNNFQIDAIEKCLDLEEHQIPRCVGAAEFVAIANNDGKAKEKLRRSSSISMKVIKEMQRELQSEFSRNVCCKSDREPIQKIFHEHFNKLSAEQRKVIFMRISKMDFKTAYG